MTEDELLTGLLDAAMVGGWMVAHQRPGRTAAGWATAVQGHAGWPDLVAVHAERGLALFLECKAADGRLTPLQDAWLDALLAAGLDARVVTPSTYDATWRELVGDRLMAAGRPWRDSADER